MQTTAITHWVASVVWTKITPKCDLNLRVLRRKVIDNNVHCQTWNELESELNSEFQYNHGVIEEVLLASENNAINANDYF